MNPTEINADPLLDLKAVQNAYKLNLHTIKTIVDDDTMPVVWLGKKRYLRQSDLENYFTSKIKTKVDSSDMKELPEPSKSLKQTTKPKTQTPKKNPSNGSVEVLKKALANGAKKTKQPSAVEMLQAELQRREATKSVA